MLRLFAVSTLSVATTALITGIAVAATIYHVDSVAGDDETGDGSLAAPWQSLSIVNDLTLIPGDQVLLKRGSIFRDPLIIDDSGTAISPIIVDAYDDEGEEGARPIISAGHLISQDAGWSETGTNGEYSLTLGLIVVDEFVTSDAVLVRAAPSGVDTYSLCARGTPGQLAEDTCAVASESGFRVIYYKPLPGETPNQFEFELSKAQAAIIVLGDHVRVANVQAILGNFGNPNLTSPLAIPTFPATIYAEGVGVEFYDCLAAFGRSFGIAVTGPNSLISGCTAEYNNSTGLNILGVAATGSTIQNSIARFNGNLEFADQDRGGIGVQQ